MGHILLNVSTILNYGSKVFEAFIKHLVFQETVSLRDVSQAKPIKALMSTYIIVNTYLHHL